MVYTSTVSTVGLPNWELSTEESLADPAHLAGHYKKSKYQAEQLALNMAAAGLPIVVVNPTTPVGPWDVRPTPTGKMVLDFLLGRIPAWLDTGMNLVDVEDVAVGHILAMERGQPGQRYLLGNRNVTPKRAVRHAARGDRVAGAPVASALLVGDGGGLRRPVGGGRPAPEGAPGFPWRDSEFPRHQCMSVARRRLPSWGNPKVRWKPRWKKQ